MKQTRHLYLGLDTSAYVTSLALIDEDEQLIWEGKAQLPVPKGSLEGAHRS